MVQESTLRRAKGDTKRGLALEERPARITPPWARTLRRFRAHRLAMVGVVIILVFTALATAAPLVTWYTPNEIDLQAIRQPPSREHILGTDVVGRDQWSRVVYGGRISLRVGLIATSIYMAIGLLLGAMSGYIGGWWDNVIMRFTEVVMSFPTGILIMIMVSILGPSINNVMLVIGLFGWPGIARLARGQILSLRAQDFIIAARAVGVSSHRVILRHLLPNIVGPMTVAATFGVAGAILAEAGLSFLGFGVRPPTPSWGLMINEARGIDVLSSMPWLWLPPGLAISLCVVSINFIGDGLRDAFDVRGTE